MPPDVRGLRAALTTIYFLLPNGEPSRWHQVRSDEVWHLYEGGPLDLFELRSDGSDLATHRLAAPCDPTGAPVYTIPAGHWQAARAISDFALVGCTVAPGFEFADFRLLADETELSDVVRARWPEAAPLI
jgi:predicted cupin superfamily sugar epimerase